MALESRFLQWAEVGLLRFCSKILSDSGYRLRRVEKADSSTESFSYFCLILHFISDKGTGYSEVFQDMLYVAVGLT